MFNMLTMTAATDNMSTMISTLVTVFTSVFSSAWNIIEGNWFLLASVGIPLVAGILFAVISFFKKS